MMDGKTARPQTPDGIVNSLLFRRQAPRPGHVCAEFGRGR